MGGKLSRPVYLDPHPPENQSKIILLILLILIYLIVKMYQSKNIIQVKSSEFFVGLFRILSYRGVGGGKLSRPVYLDPHPPEYQSKKFFAKFSHFKLSECDDVPIINIIQVKFSCFICRIVLYA